MVIAHPWACLALPHWRAMEELRIMALEESLIID